MRFEQFGTDCRNYQVRLESVPRPAEERTPSPIQRRAAPVRRYHLIYLLGALGPTNSGTVALQGIEITQDVGWRAVELEIVRCEAGNRLQSLDV